MKHIKILLFSLASSVGALAADIDVTPGNLEGLLGEGVKSEKELRIKGAIDARDLAVFENLSSEVKSLDLSGVTIEGLTMPTRKYFGRTLFKPGEIPAYTFFKSGVRTLVLPEAVTSICEGAFAGSEITEITIPEGVTSIGDYAFYGCPNLTTVNLPGSLQSIGKGAFGNCTSLETINLDRTALTELPERAFAGAVKLSKIALPQGVSSIGREAFSHTNISELDLSKVSTFGSYALSSMPFLTKLSINPRAEISEGLLMDDISLSSLTGLPEFVPDYFAANCQELPSQTVNQASTLGRYSFANTLSPEELVLTGTITRIDRGAFSGLSNIGVIDVVALEDRLPVVEDETFEGIVPEQIVLTVNYETVDLWKNDPVWGRFQVKPNKDTSVDQIGAETLGAPAIALRGGRIVVESPVVVTDIRVYTTDGRVAYIASPLEEKVEIPADSLPSGVVIVTATDRGGNSKTISLLLK